MKIKFSRMTILDIPEVMALELDTFTSPWSERLFRDELEQEFSYTMLARCEDGSLAGFICFWVLVDEVHILNLAVRADLRRRGIGSQIVTEALRYAKNKGATVATLEVRQSNEAAIGLYARLGFVNAGRRRNYYDSPRENAVIMWLYDIDAALVKSP